MRAGAGLAWVLIQRAMRALQPPPSSPMLIAAFNKAAGFAERHFSQMLPKQSGRVATSRRVVTSPLFVCSGQGERCARRC